MTKRLMRFPAALARLRFAINVFPPQNFPERAPASAHGATEKHIPIYKKVEDEIVVSVGEVEHPMEKEHYIMWIAQVSENRITRVKLYPEQATETRFPYISGATLYAYCNKHGLWKTTIK